MPMLWPSSKYFVQDQYELYHLVLFNVVIKVANYDREEHHKAKHVRTTKRRGWEKIPRIRGLTFSKKLCSKSMILISGVKEVHVQGTLL